MDKNQLFQAISRYLEKNGAKKVMVFGSYARGEATKNSDVDIIVEFSHGKSLLDLVGLEQELSDLVGVKIDLHTKQSISPYIKRRVLREAQVIHS